MKHLLAITIGPVQGFISAARRTRDLWAGSLVLSEISKAVARGIWERDSGALIFPSPAAPAQDLERNSAYSVANVILAEVEGSEVAAHVERARSAAESVWRTIADDAFEAVSSAVHTERFHEQLGGVIEFTWASTPVVTGGSYKAARREVMRALAARKACRDFEPWKGYAKVPKSSLDGLRESIWLEERLDHLAGWKKAQLRLNDGEQLDAVGLAKRLGMGARQFPSVARIAAEPWIDVLEKRGLLPRLVEACEPLRGDLVSYSSGRFSQFRRFPFDGTAVYESRLHEIEPASADSEHKKDVLESNVAALRQTLRELTRACGAPSPYLAVLAADGDRMGEKISALESAEEHRRFSRALAGFAAQAERVVREHGGALVFAGGDDVLAFVPAHRAIECAAALRSAFLHALREFPGPTLSVGVAYGHFLEDLEDLVKRAKDAEHEAKQPNRNGLAVRYSPRNQEGRQFRCEWSSKPEELLARMIGWHRQSLIPDQAAYQLTGLARHYSKWEKDAPVAAAMQADAQRLLSRKARKTAPAVLDELRDVVKRHVTEPADLQRLADQLVITRKLAPIGVSR